MSGTMMPTMCQILVVTQLIFLKTFQNMRSAGYHEKMIGRTYFGGDQVTQLNLVLNNTIKWPYQPKHSPSIFRLLKASCCSGSVESLGQHPAQHSVCKYTPQGNPPHVALLLSVGAAGRYNMSETIGVIQTIRVLEEPAGGGDVGMVEINEIGRREVEGGRGR